MQPAEERTTLTASRNFFAVLYAPVVGAELLIAGPKTHLEAMVIAEDWWTSNGCGSDMGRGEKIRILRYKLGEAISEWVADYHGPA